jgi:hypothetical protein
MGQSRTSGIVGWLRADPKRIVGAIVTGLLFPIIVIWVGSTGIFEPEKPVEPKKPDVIIDTFNTPDLDYAGTSTKGKVPVHNQGTATAEFCRVAVYDGEIASEVFDPEPVVSEDFNLRPRASHTATVYVPLPSPSGAIGVEALGATHYVSARVECTNHTSSQFVEKIGYIDSTPHP